MKKIGVVGEGLVGSCFKGKSDYHVVHRDEWDAHIFNWSGIVNCCAIAGAARCDAAGFDAVNRANVVLPREMAYMARNLDIPFITFSTSAVYARPSGNYPVDESSPLYPHNLYASSKITMEAVMPENAFIFRIPIVITGSGAPNDFPQKVQGWKVVEDVDISIIFGGTIVDAVSRVMTGGREDERTGRWESEKTGKREDPFSGFLVFRFSGFLVFS